MKRILAIFIIFVLNSIPQIGNTQWLRISGSEWSKVSQGFKIGFATGWVAAGTYGEAFVSELNRNLDEVLKTDLDRKDKLDSLRRRYNRAVFGKYFGIITDVAPKQVVDTIDWIYLDPRVQGWDLTEIMPMVRGRLQDGWTLKDLDEVISYEIKIREIEKKLKLPTSSEEKEKLIKEEVQLKLNQPKVLLDMWK